MSAVSELWNQWLFPAPLFRRPDHDNVKGRVKVHVAVAVNDHVKVNVKVNVNVLQSAGQPR